MIKDKLTYLRMDGLIKLLPFEIIRSTTEILMDVGEGNRFHKLFNKSGFIKIFSNERKCNLKYLVKIAFPIH